MGKKKFINRKKGLTFELACTTSDSGKDVFFLKPCRSEFKSELDAETKLKLISSLSDIELLKEYRKSQREGSGSKIPERLLSQLIQSQKVSKPKCQEQIVVPPKEQKRGEDGLTDEQRRLLQVVLPEDYKKMKFQGVRTKKYDVFGLPLDEDYDYTQHVYQGGGRTVCSVFQDLDKINSKAIDIDVDVRQIDEQNKQLLQCMDAEEEAGYEQLQDDFFIRVAQKGKIKEQKKAKSQSEKQAVKSRKVTQTAKERIEERVFENGAVMTIIRKKGKLQELPSQEEEEIQEVDEVEEEQEWEDCDQQSEEGDWQQVGSQQEGEEDGIQKDQVSDKDLVKALKDFDSKGGADTLAQDQRRRFNIFKDLILKGATKKQSKENLAEKLVDQLLSDEEEEEDLPQGRDLQQVEWREMTKDQKRAYMKRGKVWDPTPEQAREKQIEEKTKGKPEIDPSTLKLRQRYQKIPFDKDHLAKQVLEKDSSDQEGLTRPEKVVQDDIVSYTQKTSVIFNDLNFIQPSKKKPSKKKEQRTQEYKESKFQESLQKEVPKCRKQKRNRNQTSQERRERKKNNQLEKKERREQRKELKAKFRTKVVSGCLQGVPVHTVQ